MDSAILQGVYLLYVSSIILQFIFLLHKVGAIENIKWLAERMLALYGLPNKTPKMSNISPQGTVSSNDIATECSLVKDISLNAASANSETRERRFRIACLADHKAVINLYNGTILPAIGESGQASHPVIELLLQQLDDAMRAIFNTID